MATLNDQNERLIKFLNAGPVQQTAIDRILEGRAPVEQGNREGPLLLGMGAAARFLGVSRTTLWRMEQAGRLRKIEILPGSYRIRRADLELIANEVETDLAS